MAKKKFELVYNLIVPTINIVCIFILFMLRYNDVCQDQLEGT